MRGIARSWLLVTACSALMQASCQGFPPRPMQSTPAETQHLRDQLSRWLECDECWNGELAAVAAAGPKLEPSLIAVLREGMSPATRARLARQLQSSWDAAPHAAAGFAREEYVALELGNRDALHRVRAALALGEIASITARAALEQALAQGQRPSVEQAIRAALGS